MRLIYFLIILKENVYLLALADSLPIQLKDSVWLCAIIILVYSPILLQVNVYKFALKYLVLYTMLTVKLELVKQHALHRHGIPLLILLLIHVFYNALQIIIEIELIQVQVYA